MKFAKISQKLALWAGSPKTFMGALILIALWGLTGPIFDYNDTWQLIINTSTTIITFLMVFLIQNTQNRDTDILHLKIDELLRVNKEAKTRCSGSRRWISSNWRPCANTTVPWVRTRCMTWRG
jgi:low affinity Fe/Cu permease